MYDMLHTIFFHYNRTEYVIVVTFKVDLEFNLELIRSDKIIQQLTAKNSPPTKQSASTIPNIFPA